MTVPSLAAYDPGVHLSYGDVTFNSQTQPTVAQVNIKADPFHAGVLIYMYMGRTNCDIGPVAALVAYYTMRGTETDPFFKFREGTPLSKEKLVEKLRESLTVIVPSLPGIVFESERRRQPGQDEFKIP